MNILHVILDLKLAGAQEVVRTLAEYLQAQDCVITVCSFEDGPMRAKLEALGIKVEIIERPRYEIAKLPLFLAELRRIRQQLLDIVDRHHIEIIQTHLLEVLDFVALSVRGHAQVKAVLWTIHNVEILPTMPGRLLPAKRWVYRQLYRRLGQRVDGFIAVSDEVRQAIITQLGPQIAPKVITINNGVDVKRYQHIKIDLQGFRNLAGLNNDLQGLDLQGFQNLVGLSSLKIILAIGRLTEQKGHRYLIEAMPHIIKQHPNAHLLIVGEGELETSLKTQAAQTGYAQHIHFLGKRLDIPQLLAAAQIFVLPSLWEGLSIALLEAMAAAKPIVATAVSGTNQVLTHNITGLIIPPADSPALATALNKLLDQPDFAHQLGHAAQQHVIAHYSAEQQALAHVRLYERLLR